MSRLNASLLTRIAGIEGLEIASLATDTPVDAVRILTARVRDEAFPWDSQIDVARAGYLLCGVSHHSNSRNAPPMTFPQALVSICGYSYLADSPMRVALHLVRVRQIIINADREAEAQTRRRPWWRKLWRSKS